MAKCYLGFDIGGTKCTAIYGAEDAQSDVRPLDRVVWPTAGEASPRACVERFCDEAKALLERHGADASAVAGIGVICGSPLDNRNGIILSPPNLPGWDEIPVVEWVKEAFPACPKVTLENDANADALAEWAYGAGRGTRNMVFITFGTGCGAGLILDGRLYTGTNDYAGECGHIRLAPFGPVGYGKAGSMEGFCSGGGLARLAEMRAQERLQMGQSVPWLPKDRPLTAKDLAEAAAAGDALALSVFAECGNRLGEGLAILMDLLNPEVIVIGSVFQRAERFLRPTMEAAIAREALPYTQAVCRVAPAALGDALGEYAALALAAFGG